MKILKHFQLLMLSLIILLSGSNITAYAKEIPQESDNIIATYEFDINSYNASNNVIPLANVNDTFYVYNGSHTGSTRSYYGSKLKYTVTITDINGNPVNNILSVQLYSGNVKIHEGQFWANGSSNTIYDISISSGNSYYFKYIIAYGNTQTLKVRMSITAYT